jgi:hypothetical protein
MAETTILLEFYHRGTENTEPFFCTPGVSGMKFQIIKILIPKPELVAAGSK